jgi:hypothetical protein
MNPQSDTSLGRPPLPREHGAWGILLVPLVTALGVSRVFNLQTALLIASVLCFFIARTSYLRAVALSEGPLYRRAIAWAWVLMGASVLAAAPLLLWGDRWWLLAFGAVAMPIAFRKPSRSFPAQLLAMMGLTLTAPVAWYVATGKLDDWAWMLWGLNALYFASGFFYVKMHFAAVRQRSSVGVARGVILYHLLLMALLAGLVAGDILTGWMALAFAPALGRAAVGIVRLRPVVQIKRLAWLEVGYSLLFATSLIAAATAARGAG